MKDSYQYKDLKQTTEYGVGEIPSGVISNGWNSLLTPGENDLLFKPESYKKIVLNNEDFIVGFE